MVRTVPATFDDEQLDFAPRNLAACYFGTPPVSLRAPALRLDFRVGFQGCLLCFPVASVTLMIPMEILALCIWAESWDYFGKLSKYPRSALHLCSCAEALALA